MKTTITLTSYDMGDGASEEDFEAWTDYVCEEIARACGFAVDVECEPFGAAGRDRIKAETEEKEEIAKEALQSLWASWCEGGEA